MTDPIDRPWNAERDAEREQAARQERENKERSHKRCWIWAAVVVAAGIILGIYAAANPDPCSRANSAQRLAELHLEDGLIGPATEALNEASKWRTECLLQD